MTCRHLLIGVATLVVVAGLWWWRSVPATEQPGPRVRAVTRPMKVPGVMLVNDGRDATLGIDTALFAELLLTNPGATAVDLMLDRLTPVLRAETGSEVAVTWERLALPEARLEPDATQGVRWVATTAVPAGLYRVSVEGPPDAMAGPSTRLSVEPARLRVLDAPDADGRQAAAVQLRAWRGDTTGALADIDAALVQTPGALVLQLWRADLLRSLGREQEAQQQWRALAETIDRRQREAARGEPDIPFWITDRIAGR